MNLNPKIVKIKITGVESAETKRLERLISGMHRGQTGFKATLRAYIVSENMDYRRLLEKYPGFEPPTYQTDPYYYTLVERLDKKQENSCESLFGAESCMSAKA